MRLVAARMGTGTFYPFEEMGLFTDCKMAEDARDLTRDDLLVVWGGADISPSLYNKQVSNYTGAYSKPSMRDAYEWSLMQRAKELEIPIVGVCRGAQMLCALAGGFLVQDVSGHGRSHAATTKEGYEFTVSSIHHQMLYPFDVDHEMIAWATNKQSSHYVDVVDGEDTNINVDVEPEAVYFPKVRGLAIQWHPEFMDDNCPATRYVEQKVREYYFGD